MSKYVDDIGPHTVDLEPLQGKRPSVGSAPLRPRPSVFGSRRRGPAQLDACSLALRSVRGLRVRAGDGQTNAEPGHPAQPEARSRKGTVPLHLDQHRPLLLSSWTALSLRAATGLLGSTRVFERLVPRVT
jgi:hypothetical protein